MEDINNEQYKPTDGWDKSPAAISNYHAAATLLTVDTIKESTEYSLDIPIPFKQATEDDPRYQQVKQEYESWNERCSYHKRNQPYSRVENKRARCWLLTCFYYNAKIINQTLRAMIKNGTLENCAVGFETCPDTNREHIHIMLQFFNAVRATLIKNAFPYARRDCGTYEHAQMIQAYCLKGCDDLSRNWYTSNKEKKTHQKRKEFIEALVSKKMTLTDIRQQAPDFYYYNEKVLHAIVCSEYHSEKIDRHVIWIWGNTGAGKSKFVNTELLQNIKEKEPTFDIGSQTWDSGIMNAAYFQGLTPEHQVAIFDDLRDDTFKFNSLLRLLGPTALKVEIKGGHTYWMVKYVIITCDTPPWELYQNMQRKLGTQNPIEQLLRRINHAFHIGENQEMLNHWHCEPQPGQMHEGSLWKHWTDHIKPNVNNVLTAQVPTFNL